MSFSRRRGRPKKLPQPAKDKGTIELQQKRLFKLTSEPLDLCLGRELISEEQHQAGIRLRWLYTLRFGTPTIGAYSPDDLGGHSCKYEDQLWLAKRHTEYNNILQQLDRYNSRKIVMDICVFSHMPEFLYTRPDKLNISALTSHKQLTLFTDGLDAIASLRKEGRRYG